MPLNGRIETGAMPETLAKTTVMKPSDEFKIAIGYHDGAGVCTAAALSESTPANATSNDIVNSFKGYVNGVLVTGNLPEIDHSSTYTSFLKTGDNYSAYFQRGVYTDNSSLPLPDQKSQIQVPSTEVARICEISPDKLAHGSRCCDVVGTYSSDATAMESDIIKNKVGYKLGHSLVGTLKTMDIYNPGVVRNEDESVTFSWSNPANGPYAGIIIRYAWTAEGADTGTILYQGYGSNKTPNGRSSVSFSNLQDKDYYISIRSYCGPLISSVVFHFTINQIVRPGTVLAPGLTIANYIGMVSAVFTKSPIPPNIGDGFRIADISEAQDKSVVMWHDYVDDIQYWYSDYSTVYMNPDSSNMFSYCFGLTSIDLSGFNTSKVTNMNNMFNECNALISVDVSDFNTSNVTDMSCMFSRCYKLASLDLSNFDTSNVTNMGGMFVTCGELKSLDLSSFNTSKVTSMGNMFGECTFLSTITYGTSFVNTSLKGLTLSTSDNYTSNMFNLCPANKPTWTDGTWTEDGTFIKS